MRLLSTFLADIDPEFGERHPTYGQHRRELAWVRQAIARAELDKPVMAPPESYEGRYGRWRVVARPDALTLISVFDPSLTNVELDGEFALSPFDAHVFELRDRVSVRARFAVEEGAVVHLEILHSDGRRELFPRTR